MSALRKQLLETSLQVLHDVNHFDSADVWGQTRTSDATHTMYPTSLGFPSKMDNPTLGDVLFKTIGHIEGFTVRQLDGTAPLIDEEQRTAVLRLLGTGGLKGPDGKVFAPFHMEYVLTLQMTDSGEKVRESWEFIDSHHSLQLAGKAPFPDNA